VVLLFASYIAFAEEPFCPQTYIITKNYLKNSKSMIPASHKKVWKEKLKTPS